MSHMFEVRYGMWGKNEIASMVKLNAWMDRWHVLTAPEIAGLFGFFSYDLNHAGFWDRVVRLSFQAY